MQQYPRIEHAGSEVMNAREKKCRLKPLNKYDG